MPLGRRAGCTVLKRAPAGSLEHSVLTVLWDRGDWLTPGEVHERLDLPRPVGYATVTTVLVRLWRKGRLERRKAGHAFAYHVRQTREQFVAQRMDEILAVAADRPTALAHFVEALSDADRDEIQRRLGGG
jgi:predicted transcriptional regulator